MEGPHRHQEPVRALRRALVAVVLALSAPAFAQDDPTLGRAKELFENGQILYEEGQYEAAILAWEESYRLSGYPDMLYNIASAHEKLGQYEKAISALSRYRALAPSDERDVLDRRLRSLELRLEQSKASSSTTPTTSTTTTASTPTTSASTPTMTTTSSPSAGGGRGGVRVLPIALIATGVAGIGSGGVFALQANGARSEIRAGCADQGGAYVCPDALEPAVRANRRSSTLSTVGFAAGGVLTAGGIALSLVGPGASDLTVAPVIASDGIGLRWDGSF